jgi:uncharacterized protein (UPF0264 family)
MAGLLVSVRSVVEAQAAVAGGAVLVDVKEPARGSLGRADDGTIAAVVAFAGKHVPVSAALGELVEGGAPFPRPGLSYAKWGLSGCRRLPTWSQQLVQTAERTDAAHPGCHAVAVGYADWQRADAPPVDEVIAAAIRHRFRAVLLDTWCKDDSTLLDWVSLDHISRICRSCRAARMQLALAGRLGRNEIEELHDAEPTWFAVRGAVCRGGSRQQSIDPEAVRRLSEFLSTKLTANAGS